VSIVTPKNDKGMSMSVTWTDTAHEIAGGKLHLSRAGSGRPLLVLHHDIGTPDRLPFYDALASGHDVLVPHHPGWGKSERPAWMRHPRDIAAMHATLLAELGLTDVTLVGLGFGGWVAAEMATHSPAAYRRLVLVGPMGIKPPEGFIMDQAIVSYVDYPQAGFHDPAAFTRVFGEVTTDQLEQWDICREMSFRTAWKPYMYSQALPHLIGGIRAPALVVWGDDDRHVPISAAPLWQQGLRDATLHTIPACGHYVDMEKPDELARLVTSFVNAN
jgi:pimeloyl-ACP methyl ester carboxylesterase